MNMSLQRQIIAVIEQSGTEGVTLTVGLLPALNYT
jgi:hypothetical protein